MEPLVSIIMGVYNAENTIRRAIDSVLSQTYNNWELIICDDCSLDNTFDILNEYHEIDKRITVIKNETNKRLAASLNHCLEQASGKYIARMDSDDENLPTRLEEQVGFLESHPEIDLVGTNRIIFDDRGDKGVRKSIEKPTKRTLLKGSPFAHPTIMTKKTVYDTLGGYAVSKKTMRAEDIELWFRFYEHGYRGYNMQKALYRYRESLEDLKKRSVKAGIETSKVYYAGYKLLRFPVYERIWALKPIISSLVPHKMMMKYFERGLKEI